MDEELYDLNEEQRVLGYLFEQQAGYINELRTQQQRPLRVELFYQHQHQVVLQAIFDAIDNGVHQPGVMFIKPFIPQKADSPKLKDLADIMLRGNEVPSHVHFMEKLALLTELYLRRTINSIGDLLVSSSTNRTRDIADIIETSQQSLTALTSDTAQHVVTLHDTIKEVYDTAISNTTEVNVNKIVTGFPYLDEQCPILPSDLIVVAGATSQGKTSFATSVTVNALRHGASIAFYSMEMTRQQITARLLSKESKVKSFRILYDKLTNDEIQTLDESIRMYADIDTRMYFDDRSNSSIESILISIRSLRQKHKISGAVIDYLQILSAIQRMGNLSTEEQLGTISRLLKNIAKELNIFIILLSQIRRDPQSPCPNISMLRGSGQIAEAADSVYLVYRPQYYNEEYGLNLSYPAPFENVDVTKTAMIMIAKGRNVGTGKFICGFDASATDFYPLVNLPYKTGDNLVQTTNDDPLSPF